MRVVKSQDAHVILAFQLTRFALLFRCIRITQNTNPSSPNTHNALKGQFDLLLVHIDTSLRRVDRTSNPQVISVKGPTKTATRVIWL